MTKPTKGQLTIPIVTNTQTRIEMTDEDRERAYADLMGEQALARQREAAAIAAACTCGRGGQSAARHEPNCRAIPLRRR